MRYDCEVMRKAGVPANFFARYIYGIAASVAYLFGLITAFMMLRLMSTAQPALLYLCPFTCGTVWSIAWCRGHLEAMLRGIGVDEAPPPENDDIGYADSSDA